MGAPQRYRYLLAGIVAGAALVVVRLAVRPPKPSTVREIVREPVIDVAAPSVELVPDYGGAARESRLRRIAGVLALMGLAFYVYLTLVYDHFYTVLHVEPADVGFGYATTLSRSSGLIVIVVAIMSGTWLLLRWIQGSLAAVVAFIIDIPILMAFAIPALLVGVAALWAAAPILTYPYTEPTREASVAARAVLAGKPVAPVRLGPVTLIDLRAEAVTMIAARSGDSAVRSLMKRTDLLYLGHGDGTVVLFDSTARQALHVPADAVLMRLSRPTPRQGRSLLCAVTPPPSWWHHVNDGRKLTPWRRMKTDPSCCHDSSVAAAGTRPRSRSLSR